MQHLEVSSAVRHIYMTLGGKGLTLCRLMSPVVKHFAEKFQRLERDDQRLKSYHVTVSFCGIIDILYVFTVCSQHEMTDASNKNKTTEVTATLAPNHNHCKP
jgi:hypothetical protein